MMIQKKDKLLELVQLEVALGVVCVLLCTLMCLFFDVEKAGRGFAILEIIRIRYVPTYARKNLKKGRRQCGNAPQLGSSET
jgi:hypothetical protein